MKNSKRISSFFLTIVVAILLSQAFHSYSHLKEIFEQKPCFHNNSIGKTQITHAHHSFEDCSLCLFSLGNSYLKPNKVLSIYKKKIAKKLSFYITKQNISFYKGSFFSLRAPPYLMF